MANAPPLQVASTTTPGFSVCARNDVVRPYQSGKRRSWSWVSIAATGSTVAAKRSTWTSSSGRRSGVFTRCPSIVENGPDGDGSISNPSKASVSKPGPIADSATSSVSLAAHIANANPPWATYSRTLAATAALSSIASANPSSSAVARSSATASRYQAADWTPRPYFPYWPVKSSWWRWTQSISARPSPRTSASQIRA